MNIETLIRNGYFPKELPPIFNTELFADLVLSGKKIEPPSKDFSKGIKYYIPKNRHFKRLITIPNPAHQYLLTQHLLSNFSQLSDIFNINTNSYSIPEFNLKERRSIASKKSYNDYIRDRVIKSCGYKYVLTTDISRFYQTIYTHSIPWAIDGKEIAKSNKGKDNFSNGLDRLLRNLQDQQTLGIPVGPDISRIISEVVLCDIDRLILEKYPDLPFLRYVDDYTIPCKSIGSAKEILNEITRIFNIYELDVNESKTEILELPIEIEHNWVTLLKSKKIGSGIKKQESDLIAYFNIAFDIFKKFPSKNVLHYAITEKLAVKIYPENWKLFESIILQCIIYEPRVIPLVGRLLFTYKELGYNLNDQLIHNCLLGSFNEKVQNSNSFELVWAVYILCQLQIEIEVNLHDFVSSEDTMLLLAIMYSREKGFYKGSISKTTWQKYIESDCLYGDSWLFTYECHFHDWLKHKKGKDICSNDAFFSQLRSDSISFIDSDASLKIISSKYLDFHEDEKGEDEHDTSEILYDDEDDENKYSEEYAEKYLNGYEEDEEEQDYEDPFDYGEFLDRINE